MERKKQGSLSRPSPSSTAAARASASIEDERKQNLTQSGNFDQSETPIEFDCEKTLTYVGKENNSKALNLFVEDLNLRYKISTADIHLLEGLISVESATLIRDRNKKEIHLKDAMVSARKAVSLFPNCINYVHFYAIQLYFASNDCKGYEEVVQECHRALLIQNSIPVSGVAHNMKPDLHSIIQRSNIALISIWMKKITGEKARLVPTKQISKDLIEVEHNESKKSNKRMEEFKKDISVPTKQILEDPIEVELRNKSKKSNKTEEERRKEIEVRVTAARILQQQQKSTSPQSKNDEEENYRASEKIDPLVVVKRNRILSYWNTLSLNKKRSLLKVSIHDLEAYFKDGLEMQVLSKALSFGKANGNWQFWACPRCNEKFANYDSLRKHVRREHVKVLSISVLPQKVRNNWVAMILNGPWLPIDISNVLRILEGSKDTSESSPDKGKVTYLECEWPLSNDSERMELLEKVKIMLQLLLKHEYLTERHITNVIQFTMDKIQHIPHIGSWVLDIGLEKTLFGLCFLSPSQLKKILKSLEELSDYCGLGREKDSTIDDETHSVTQESEIKEGIILRGGSLCFLLEDSADCEAVLTWILDGPSSQEQLASWKCPKDDKIRCGMEILQKINEENSLLQSLCESKCEQLNREVALETVERFCLRECKERVKATEFVSQSYEVVLQKQKEELVERKNEFEAVSNVLNEAKGLKVSQFGYEESLTGKDEDWRMQDLLYQADTCIETAFLRHKDRFSVEFSKIDAKIVHTDTAIKAMESKLGSFSARDYQAIMLPLLKSFLQSHLEEIADKYATEKSEAAEKALLAELALNEKKSINKGGDYLKQKHKSKNKKNNKGNCKAKNLKPSGGEKASGSIVENMAPEVSVVDSKLDSGDPNVHEQLRSEGPDMVPNSEVESLSISCHEKPREDPLVGKPDISKDLLAELVLDDKKSTNKAKDLKAGGGNEEIAEQTHFLVVSDDLKQKEGEFRRKLETETDAKKFEETLEYQMRIENEVKQKLQAELHEKASESILEKVAPELSVVDSKPDSGDPNVHEQLRHGADSQKIELEQSRTYSGGPNMVLSSEVESPSISCHEDPSVGKPDLSKDILSVPIQSSEGTAMLGKSSTNSGGQGTLEVLPTGQCRWKQSRGKQQNSSTKLLEKPPQALSSEKDTFQAPNEVVVNSTNGKNVIGTGLKNKVGDNNCFLNVIIQSLWNLKRFRIEFWGRSVSWHNTVGNPCVICALYDILDALSESEIETQSEAIDPTCLRVALSKFYPNSNFFQEAQMNDASEVLAAIFDCLHKSFTTESCKLNAELEENNCISSWDCSSNDCVAYTLFGMNIFERMNCNSCGRESRCQKYTSFFHNVNANALRTMKITSTDSSFDELLNLEAIDRQLACDPEVGGCGKLNYIHRILSKPPQVFTTVLGWQSVHESENNISATLAILTTELDIGVVYRGLDPGNKRCLVSVVCYYGHHYLCFIYNHRDERWFLYDDQTVKVTGSWNDVLTTCKRGHLQPQILFFEAVH